MTIHNKQFMFAFKAFLPAAALLASIFCTSVTTLAQEADIEIVNPNGERVDGSNLIMRADANQPTPADQKTATSDAKKQILDSADGKLTVTDDDGNEQQIDLDSAQSIVVQQSTQSINNNGQQETKVVGKAIVIGSDGQRHEIDLGENGVEGLAIPRMPKGFPGMFGAKRFSAKQNASKYMIGVHCAPIPPALQAQLGLEEGTGLLVDAVGQDSPAAAAGLQKHDILLFAEDQELRQQADLVSVVQKAGEGNLALSLSVMRGGNEIGVEVSPVERTARQMGLRFPQGAMDFDLGGLGLGGDFARDFGDVEFKQFGPGMIVGGNFDDAMDDMRQQMEQVQKQMQEMQQRMQRQINPGE